MQSEPEIIFEDSYLLVVNKPAGMVVNLASTVEATTTLHFWLGKNFPQYFDYPTRPNESDFYLRHGIVHRLDKDTSGLLMVAKNSLVFDQLQAKFKKRQVKKEYLALVHNKVNRQKGTIDEPILRNRYDREKFSVFLGGRPAITSYEVIAYLRGWQKPKKGQKLEVSEIVSPALWKKYLFGQPIPLSESQNNQYEYFSLVLVKPKTGRTHQIRVHFKHINHPLAGDTKYAGHKNAKRDMLWCPRHFLHAFSLVFEHPVTGRRLEFFTKLPKDLADIVLLASPVPLG